jgi:hypothetical protein
MFRIEKLNITKRKISLNWLTAGLLAYSTIYITLTIFSNQIGLDGGFYLSIGRNLWQNHINYFDIASSYNPLGIMLLGMPYAISENPFHFSFLLYFLFIIIDTFLFYFICNLFYKDNRQSIFISSIFLLYIILLDGQFIVLEPIQLFFIFLSLIFTFKKKFILVGIAFFSAFMTKQYSLALIVPITWIILAEKDNFRTKSINLITLITSFLGSCFLFYMMYASDFRFDYFLLRILGKVPELSNSLSVIHGTGEGYNFLTFSKSLMTIAFYFPLIWIPLITLKKYHENKLILVLIISFSSVLFFAAYFHYFILIFPWGLILLHLNFRQLTTKVKPIIYLLLLCPTIILGVKMMRSKINLSRQDSNISNVLQNHIPKSSKVYIVNVSMSQYALCQFNSIDYKTIGYSFPNIIKKEVVINALKSGSYLIANEDYIGNENKSSFQLIHSEVGFSIFKKI